jgi:hypothetical protein
VFAYSRRAPEILLFGQIMAQSVPRGVGIGAMARCKLPSWSRAKSQTLRNYSMWQRTFEIDIFALTCVCTANSRAMCVILTANSCRDYWPGPVASQTGVSMPPR